MIRRLQQHAIPIVIAVTFYVTGFFTIANLLVLSGREILVGLVAGTIGGLCMLVIEMLDEQGPPSRALT